MRARREIVAACAAIFLAACSAAAAGPAETSESASPTATIGGVGELPPVASTTARGAPDIPSDTVESVPDDEDDSPTTDDDATSTSPTTTSPARPSRPSPPSRPPWTPELSTTSSAPEEPPVPIGERVTGNRVLMVGDSILASTSRRYGNNMCRHLEPLGWQVAVEAEVSREISFGNRVLRARLDAGWDAALVLLGNNYGRNPAAFATELEKMLAALAPRPVLLLTVTEFEPVQREVNDIIRALGRAHPHVTVVDWGAMSEFDGVLSLDGLHLTDNGREFLARVIAPYFGTAPAQPGDCLSSTFHDDSAGSVNGPSGNNRPPSTTVRPTSNTVRPTATTVRPPQTTVRPTQTTVRPTQTTVRPPSGTTPATTSPPQPVPTPPPQTSALPQQTTPLPQQTSPPPQQTSPPPQQTLPPQTLPVTLPPGTGG